MKKQDKARIRKIHRRNERRAAAVRRRDAETERRELRLAAAPVAEFRDYSTNDTRPPRHQGRGWGWLLIVLLVASAVGVLWAVLSWR